MSSLRIELRGRRLRTFRDPSLLLLHPPPPPPPPIVNPFIVANMMKKIKEKEMAEERELFP